MAKYFYTALKDNKDLVKGEIEARNAREAREKIRELGFLPTKVYSEDAEFKDETISLTTTENSRVSYLSLQEKIMFTSELEVMLSAGIPIIEALTTIENNSPKYKLKIICADIKNGILSGMTFAQALTSLYGKVFGAIYTGLVKTGEDSGELEATLRRMLVLLKKQERIKGKIISASIYPSVLLLLMLGVLILFSKVIFPAFYGVIQMGGGSVPFLAQMLIDCCNFVNNFWWLLIMFIAGACGFLVSLFKQYQFKRKWDEFILKVPVICDFIRYINLSNFLTVLHISYDAGLPLMSGLELSNKTVGNNIIRRQVTNSVNFVKQGKTLTESFERTGVFPGALMTMIAAGEKSGTLGKMFHDAADVMDKKIDMALEALTKLFEPVVIVIMGGFVLFIAIAFYQLYAGMLGSLF